MIGVMEVGGAYRRAMMATAGPRSIEAETMEKINREMIGSAARRNDDFPGYVAALARNASLWTVLAADVVLDSNPLPNETKALIWNLSAFVRRVTQDLMRGEGKGDIASLIEINSNVASGLRGVRRGD